MGETLISSDSDLELDVSVVVCVRNGAGLLRPCLESVAANRPCEIIVVDGASSDSTVDVASEFASLILDDEGKGLARARNMGAQAAAGGYVAFIGPDNVLPAGTLHTMLAEKDDRGWAGVSAMTRLQEPRGYLANAMDRYKSYRFRAGERAVIGTPTLFDRDILCAHLFDDRLTSSDDADLCSRMRRAGFRFGISNAVVFEQGTTAPGAVLERWRWYGQSDGEFYDKYASSWGVRRKLQSLLHPVTAELVGPLRSALGGGDAAIVPFLLLITATRYLGWAEHAVRRRL